MFTSFSVLKYSFTLITTTQRSQQESIPVQQHVQATQSSSVSIWRRLTSSTSRQRLLSRTRRLIQRSTEAKAARGTFVRWCAETGVARADELASFCERGYALDEGLSSADTLVFVRERG